MSPDMNQSQTPTAGQPSMQNPASVPADLPDPVPLSSAVTSAEPAAAQAQMPVEADRLLPIPPEAVQLQAAEHVTQLIAQYGHDPYKLNESLSQLRARYVADQYHVAPDSSGEGH